MSKTSWGLKRSCPRCSNRYYDLGKNPAACPKCRFVYDITQPVRARRGRKAAAKAENDPLVAAKVQADAKSKLLAKKPVKEIEGVNLGEFEEVEPLDSKEEIGDIEEIEDMDSIEEIEEIEEGEDEMDDDIALEDEDVGDKVLIDKVKEEEDTDEEDEEDEKSSKKSKKKPVVSKKSVLKKKPAPAKKPVPIKKKKKK